MEKAGTVVAFPMSIRREIDEDRDGYIFSGPSRLEYIVATVFRDILPQKVIVKRNLPTWF